MQLVCPKCKKDIQYENKRYTCFNCNVFYPIIESIPCFVEPKKENTGFNADTFKFLYEMEKKHFWHTARKEIIYQMLKYYLQEKINTVKMLEIGCGNGAILQYLKKKGVDVEGGDISIEGLKFCKKRINIPLYQIDALATPFSCESYDIVGIFDVIEHVEDEKSLLKEVFRICKKNGKVIITVPANKSLWSYFDVLSKHKRRYTKKELIFKLEQVGFKIEKISFFMFFLFPFYWIFRKLATLKNYKKKQDFTKLREIKTIPIINDIFLSILRIEKKLLTIFNLPIGISLICMAEKSDVNG